jgi:hypothetical protein
MNLRRPDRIVGRSERHLDWGRSSPGPRDRAKHAIEGWHPFEWWYFDGRLDDGRSFVGVFFDPLFSSGKPGVAFTLYTRGREKESRLLPLEPGQMRTSTADVSIECPAGFVRHLDENTYRVGWDIDGLIADFTLTTEAPGWRPRGDARINEDALDFFWTVHQARNRIEGRLTLNGHTSRVKGTGYADHNWGKKPLWPIARKWIWGRIMSGDYTVIYADVDYRRPVINARPLYIARKSEILVGSGSPCITQSDFALHPGLKRPWPRQVDIEFEEGSTRADICIRGKTLLEEVDLLALSGMRPTTQRLIRALIARPSYFRVSADHEGSIVCDGRKEKISGECIYEIMGFR